MKQRYSTRLLTAVVATLVLFAGHATPVFAQSQDGQAVLMRLGERYRAVQTLQADFTQQVGTSSLRGSLTVRGNSYRIEMGDQTLVSDGRTAWSYSRADNQVIVQNLAAAAGGFSVSELLTDYSTMFNVRGARVETTGGVRHDVLTLAPRQRGTSLRQAVLFVRSSDAVPTRINLTDTSGTEVAFRLSNIRVNPTVAADAFRFRTPSGAEVVDLR
ncbi:outer membrane lipoprotein carrier protein LolA [soil metagenome]